MSSKERKESSTPTAETSLIESELLLRLQKLPNVLISPHTAYYTDHALSDTVENSLIKLPEIRKWDAAWIG